jgi:hypothetical protein
MMVLPVHVVGDGAAERGELRPRRDRQEPARGQGEVDDLGKQHAGFAAQDAGLRIEGDEAVEVARAQAACCRR